VLQGGRADWPNPDPRRRPGHPGAGVRQAPVRCHPARHWSLRGNPPGRHPPPDWRGRTRATRPKSPTVRTARAHPQAGQAAPRRWAAARDRGCRSTGRAPPPERRGQAAIGVWSPAGPAPGCPAAPRSRPPLDLAAGGRRRRRYSGSRRVRLRLPGSAARRRRAPVHLRKCPLRRWRLSTQRPFPLCCVVLAC
jgi:hypothetical protein